MDKLFQIKQWVFAATFLVIASTLFIGLGEGVLLTVYKMTGFKLFSLLNEAEGYPNHPWQVIKVAVFGESATSYNAERNFADVISYELQSRFPDKKFYVRNFAQAGVPFHHHQAEIVKAVIDRYDFFLIYAGNNELVSYLNETGPSKNSVYKDRKEIFEMPDDVTVGRRPDLFGFLETHSRIYALAARIKDKTVEKLTRAKPNNLVGYDSYDRFPKEIEPVKNFSPEEFDRIYQNFADDLKEIGRLAQIHNKMVIVSSVATNEFYKPFFSVHSRQLNVQEKETFDLNFQRGREAFNDGRFQQAMNYFQEAEKIDGEVAILNYMIGRMYQIMGDGQQVYGYLGKAVDEDGHPARALSRLYEIARQVSAELPNVVFIDTVAKFHDAINGGANYKDLFVDLNHPSLAGHVMIAQNFLCQIAKTEVLTGSDAGSWCRDYSKTDVKQMAAEYKQKLHVTREEERLQELMQSRWHLGMAGLSAYPQDYWQIAQEDIEAYYEKSDKRPEDEALRLVFLGLIEGKRGFPIKTLALANEAVRESPNFVRKDLMSRGFLNGTIADQLKQWGIVYKPGERKFEMNSGIVKRNNN